MKIDMHAHFIPPEIVAGVRQGRGIDGIQIVNVEGKEWIQHRQGARYLLVKEFFDRDAILEHMDGLKLDISILSIAPTFLLYWLDGNSTYDFYRRCNNSLAKIASQSDGRLYGLATVPLQEPLLAVNELKRSIKDLGLRGVLIGTTMEKMPLDDASLVPFFEAAEDLRVPVFIHPYSVGKKERLEDHHFTNLIGNPFETCLAASRMIFSGFLDKYPSLKIILPHGGGNLPYQVGRLNQGFHVRPDAKHISAKPSTYLGRFYFDTITFNGLTLQYLVNLVGSQQVMLGTDFPFDMADIEFDKWFLSTGLLEKDLEAISAQNAIKIFNLKKAYEV